MNRRHLYWLPTAALLGAISCLDGGRKTITGPEVSGSMPAGLVSDGAHSGVAGFYFLPPVVAQPTLTGVFDPDIATLQPVVAICEVTDTPIVACGASTAGATPALRTFSTTSSPPITLDGDKYKVDWDTGEPGFEAGRLYRIFVFAGATRSELGFADAMLSTVPGQVKNTDGETIVLRDGRTLPIHFRIEEDVVLGPGPAASLDITGLPESSTAGATASVTVTARDGSGNIATGYAGTIAFTSTDPQATLPAEYTFTAGDAGTHTFDAAILLRTAGSITVTATDGAQSTISDAQTVTVTPAAAAKLVLGGIPSQTTSGIAHDVTVTARDQFENTATGYTGTVQFTSSDEEAALPKAYVFQPGDAGVKTFAGGVTLKTAGAQTLRVQDDAAESMFHEIAVTVASGSAATLQVTGLDEPVIAGVASSITVTARDANGNVASGYTGTIAFASGDALATLPVEYTFTSDDAGTHTFAPVILRTAGSVTVTATDQAVTTVAGERTVTVTAAPAATLVLAGIPASTAAGSAHDVSVTAKDEFGNIAAGYTGTVQFTSTDAAATIPAAYAFQSTDAGVRTFNGGVVFGTVGSQTLQVTDADAPALTISVTTTVTHGVASQLRFTTQPTSVLEGREIEPQVVVTAYDAFDNLASTFAGPVAIAIGSNPGGGVLSGTLQVNAALGVAAFADLRINLAGNGYTLVASAAGLTSATSAPFNIIAIEVHWTNAAGGSWSNGSNWSTGTPPTLDQNALIDLAGTYTVTLDVNATVNGLSVGAATGEQTLATTSARTLTLLGAGNVLSNGRFTLVNSTLNGTGTLGVASGAVFTLSGVVTVSTPVANAGSIVTFNASALNGGLTTAAGSLLRIQSVGFGGASLSVASGFTNHGEIEVTAATANGSSLTVNGTLVNAPGATIEIIGVSGSRALNAQLDNRGTLSVALPLTVTRTASDHINSGVIEVVGGNVSIVQSGTSPSFTNTGRVTVSTGRTMTISGAGNFTQAAGATLNGGGALTLNSTNALFETTFELGALTLTANSTTLATDISTEGLTLNLRDAGIQGPGTITNVAGSTITVTSSNFSAPLVNEGTVVAIGSSTISGSLTTAAGSLIQARSVGFGGTRLLISNGFTNHGTVELTATVANECSFLVGGGGTLVNAPGGTIAVTGTTGGRVLGAQLDNQGTMTVDVGLELDQSGADHVNTGVINLNGGNINVAQNFAGQTFTNSGTVSVGAARVLRMARGPVTNAAGAVIQGAGTFETATTASFNNAGTLTTALARIGDGFVSTGNFAPVTAQFFGIANTIPVGAGYTYTNVRVLNAATFAGSVGIAGNLTVLGSGNLNIGGNQITVAGDFATENTSVLTMQNAAGVLDVDGDVSFGGGSTNTRLTAGTLRVGGSFTQVGNAAAFAPTVGHLTILDGSTPQTVSFANPGTTTLLSHFHGLAIENASVTLGGAVFANGQLRTPSGSMTRTLSSSGHTIQVAGLDAAGLLFDNTPLRVVNGAAITRFDDATFRNMNTAATQLRLDRSADAVTFNNITFDTPPTTGLYLHLVDTDAATPVFSVTMQGTQPSVHGGFVLLESAAQLIGWPMS